MISEIFTVILQQWQLVFGLLLFSALGQGVVNAILRNLSADQLTPLEYFSLGLAGWIMPVSLLSLLWLLLGFASNTLLNRLVVPAAILVLVVIRFRRKPDPLSGSGGHPEPDSKKYFVSLLAVVLISLLLRLLFVSRALLPSYFDSAQHYSVIKNLVESGSILPLLSTTYYHPGFHILTAFLATVLNADIAMTMLVLGQIVLALMPVSVFFLVRHITESGRAGLFAVILAALGWYMPAHAANWGKYPALISLALLPFILSLAYFLVQSRASLASQKRWNYYTLIAVSAGLATLLHSRALILLLIIFIAWVIAAWQHRLSLRSRSLIFSAFVIVLVLEVLFTRKQAVLIPLFDPYLHKGLWVTVLVLFLSLFALKEHSQIVFAGLFAVCVLLASLFVPVRLPGYGVLTLLDRPLVEMILYWPLSLLGGLGLSGVEKLLPRRPFWKFSLSGYILAGATVFVVVHALASYDFYPADCCVFVGREDLAALTWMGAHLPPDARIGISVTEMNVLPSKALEAYNGGDAGIWITPLIDRVTVSFLYNSDFGQADVRAALCQSGVTHLYVGELGQPFDSARLNEHPEWYTALVFMQKTRVYEVIGCD